VTGDEAQGVYDAGGAKDGQTVFFDVSADLETISENAGGPGGGPAGGRGGPNGDAPEATGDGGSTTSSDPTDADTTSSV